MEKVGLPGLVCIFNLLSPGESTTLTVTWPLQKISTAPATHADVDLSLSITYKPTGNLFFELKPINLTGQLWHLTRIPEASWLFKKYLIYTSHFLVASTYSGIL